ncbi:ABC transporter permease subunit [Roseomonas aerophila]|jgi:putative spermidine/putrescine transport system permease protein|uniref:ABC transporter permease subunit n=1 Tax=Teichococcus aerophilus TaxID=1224513 RepID=A0ABR7RP00_9PROT|nr:ABC transporter permease subunit [Pseudoroseomonas aerophila]MBC9208103.1 ABC transporter permease subunit [Pseudoroseomonas aerophila]
MQGLFASPVAQKAWNTTLFVVMLFFLLNVLAVIAVVVVNSLGQRWFGGWLPDGFTLRWYSTAWAEFQLSAILVVTAQVAGAVVFLSLLVGVPAAYVMARLRFRGKGLVLLLFLLPLLVPPVTYGIPLATVLYQMGLGGTIWGVILANLVPAAPFVVLVMTPFVEQIDGKLEDAARVFGAGTLTIFRRILVPLLLPGMLSAGLLVLMRTLSMFELTFLTAGADSQTLVVALYYAVFAAGVRAPQSTDAMAVVYMATTLIWLLLALRFVDPTQMVGRVKAQRA